MLITYSLSENDDEYNGADDYDECQRSTDRNNCQNIKMDEDGYYCYPIIDESDPELKCSSFYDDSFSDLKLFYQIKNDIAKEAGAVYADLSSFDKNGEGLDLYQLEKDSYSKGETVVIKKISPSTEELKIYNSKETCSYYFFGRVYAKALTEYPDITDKDICFNAKQFSNLKGIIDCGYAKITFTTSYDKYTIKTCYFYEGNEMPSEIKDFINYYFFKNDYNALYDGNFDFIFSLIDSGKHPERHNNDDEDRRRRLEEVKIDISVENKNGKIYKYSVGRGNDESSKSTYNKMNYIFLIIFLIFLSL